MSGQDVRAQVLELMAQKDKIEKEISDFTLILTQNGVGMNDPLVDDEGFPINSIDLYQVRHAKQKIICLQNDHKNVMKKIENGLQGYYATTSNENIENNRNSAEMDTTPIEIIVHKTPFAKITIVSDNSPAYFAGFNVNDEIVEFGSVNSTNFKNITDIATVVQHSEGSQINIKLKRGERFINVQLVPKKWAGKGLLGCNIVNLG